MPLDRSNRHPAAAWLVGAFIAGLLALAAALGAFVYQRAADRPVGEGELFVAEADKARADLSAALANAADLDTAVKRVRNELTIEAVAVVDSNGRVLASTSPRQVGSKLANSLLSYGHQQGFFAAVATAIDDEIAIDGVTEWEQGEILYQVLQPLEDGRGLLLYYDVSELLARRARRGGVQLLTLQLLGVAAILGLIAVLLVIARFRVARRIREVEIEAQFLRQQATDLELHNQELGIARAEAERALHLAEETNRIRAEFVLMINHELRTPLTALVTGAQLLNQRALPETDRHQLFKHMVASGERLEEIIAQMLVVARIENRGLDFQLRDVSLDKVLAELADKCPRLRTRMVMSDVNPEQVHLSTDPMTLTQLIATLADNALTHGARQVDLIWRTSLPFEPMHEIGNRPDQGLFFLIVDNGPGIDSDFLPRAFEKFEKDSASSGTGLGLYIARMMADALGGSLSVHTSPHGTAMAIGIPKVDLKVGPARHRTTAA